VGRTSQAELVDRLLGGTLWKKLADWQRQGLSLHAISVKLHEDHDVSVTPSTIARWIKQREAA